MRLKKEWEVGHDMFQPAPTSEENDREKNTSPSYWLGVWRRFKQNKGALVGVAILGLMILFALVGPSLGKTDAHRQVIEAQNQTPQLEGFFSGGYKFGTDPLGRDLWTRVWDGVQISLGVALLATTFELVIGVTLGTLSGYYRGVIDPIIQRIIEVMNSIPNLIIIILLLLIFEPGIFPIALALALTSWTGMARLVRAQTLKLMSEEYILASQLFGASVWRVILKHLLPNTIGPIVVHLTFAIPNAIFFEAFLGFIGLGIRVPDASLGVIISDGVAHLQIFPHQLLIPAAVLALMMLSFNLLGDGLRDALDPRVGR